MLVLNPKQQVVLANTSFADSLSLTMDALIGLRVDELPWDVQDPAPEVFRSWFRPDADEANDQRRMKIQTNDGRQLTYLVNSASIHDEGGELCGVLVSFDDITVVEQRNEELSSALASLQESQQAIREQNEKLQFLATRDPLTQCLNRSRLF